MADTSAEDKSIMEDEDLEEGEIEDDDENNVELPPSQPAKSASVEEKKSPEKKDSKKSSSSSSRKDRSLQEDDDFMSNIESQIANVLKKEGVEPPMPSIKRPDPESDNERKSSTSRNARKRRRRKDRERRDRDKRDGASSKKRSKTNDSDNLYMVGGSPEHHSEQSDSEGTSYSSYDSDEYHRSSHDDRRNRRRDKYSSRSERERDRERDRKDRRKDRENEKEVCLRFAEFGHCPDDDCPRLHEVRQPKKMELCKFWLMECCAKKDKCSYMHGDFPCKFYYLGLKCINKDCKFMHGKPLSENLKNILLKHLDTAPKEILGDFPRIGRENASKMIAQTHIKLCEEFNIPLPESEKNSGNSKIPSLMEIKLKAPESFHDSRKEQSSRGSSRWLNRERENDSPSKQMSPNASSSISTGPGDALLSDMRGILSDKQVESMAAIGVKTVNHINNLTVAQLNDIGLSLATIGEIQATAINMHNNMGNARKEDTSMPPSPPKQLNSEDVDMRVFPKESTIKSPDTIMSPTQSDAEIQEIYKKPAEVQQPSSNMMSPPVDYSQYLRDSNLNNDNDENEDEPGLKIDETYGSDYEAEEKKDSQSEDDAQSNGEPSNSLSIPLLPPSIIDTSAFLKTTPAKVDISSSIQQQLMEKEKPVSRDPRSRDPRMAAQSKTADTIPEISSPTYRDPRQQSNQEAPRRTSIYEIESPSEDEDIQIKLSKDKDMRLPPFLRDSENGDIDLRFPFTPMSNYVPATEIEASYGTYNFEKYEVKIIDIPRPDYSDIRRSFRQSESQDPRLKKLCSVKSDSDKEEQLANITLPSDPRKRKAQEMKNDPPPQSGPKKLQISTILQNSKHYNELSSSQKMVVNDVLSELSKQLKIFHADHSPSKVFDTTFITNNPRLQQILIGLGVFVNAEGEFEEIKDYPMQTPAPQVVNLPNIHQMPPAIVPSIFNQPPPPNLMLQPPPNFLANAPNLVRPGILGMAPPNFFDPSQDAFGSLNQPPPFTNNDQMNFNRNQRQQQQSGGNNNFRNNSQRNSGNNYRNNRR